MSQQMMYGQVPFGMAPTFQMDTLTGRRDDYDDYDNTSKRVKISFIIAQSVVFFTAMFQIYLLIVYGRKKFWLEFFVILASVLFSLLTILMFWIARWRDMRAGSFILFCFWVSIASSYASACFATYQLVYYKEICDSKESLVDFELKNPEIRIPFFESPKSCNFKIINHSYLIFFFIAETIMKVITRRIYYKKYA